MLLNIYLFFVNIHGYAWILKNYASTCILDTRRIWIQVWDEYLSSRCSVDIPRYN